MVTPIFERSYLEITKKKRATGGVKWPFIKLFQVHQFLCFKCRTFAPGGPTSDRNRNDPKPRPAHRNNKNSGAMWVSGRVISMVNSRFWGTSLVISIRNRQENIRSLPFWHNAINDASWLRWRLHQNMFLSIHVYRNCLDTFSQKQQIYIYILPYCAE